MTLLILHTITQIPRWKPGAPFGGQGVRFSKLQSDASNKLGQGESDAPHKVVEKYKLLQIPYVLCNVI